MKTIFPSCHRFRQLLLPALLSVCSSTLAGPFINGDFETNVVPYGTYVAVPNGTNFLPGWTINSSGSDIYLDNGPRDGMNPYSGSQRLNINGGDGPAGTTLSQTFTTTPGETNVVSLALAQTGGEE